MTRKTAGPKQGIFVFVPVIVFVFVPVIVSVFVFLRERQLDRRRVVSAVPQTGRLCICPCRCLCICLCQCLCICLCMIKTARQDAGSISCALSGKQDQTGGNPTTCPLIFTPDRLLDYLTPHGPPSEKRCSVPQCIEESSHYLE